MEFRILGPIEAWSEGRQVRLGGVKQRALLAVLLLHRNEVVSVERLIDELWDGHPPATAVKTAQVHISQLRKALGGRDTGGDADEILVTRRPGYVLHVGPDELDSDQFERLVEHGRRALRAGNQEQAARSLLEALSLWRGPALADFALDAFAQTESARLEEARVSAIEERVEADLALGRHRAVIGELETLIRTHPLRERLRGQLMLALYRSDRQAEALAAYQDARRMLDDELGLEPSESLQQLERAILVHDPALGVPTSRSAAEAKPTVPVVRPPVRFARSGDIQVAFQVTGDGPVDIVLAPGTVSHLDLWWDFPPFRREIEAWSSFARLIRFDKRGTGLSDRPTNVATLEERTDDIRAVMDAVGLERAVIYGRSEGGQMACMFAAMYPERTTALITWGTMARWIQAKGHPWGLTREEYDQLLVELETNWPSEYYIRGPGGSFGDIDSETMTFMLRLFQAAASPAAAVALERMNAEVDIRDILPIIRVPTLLMCHTHDPEAPAEAVRWMAQQIPGARFAEFAGKSHFVGEGENLDSVVATIQEFLTGRPAAIPSHRRLLTILFLDVVGSTERAVDLGAARWRDLLTTLFDDIERELAAFDGQEIDRTGDGLLATFEGPSRAIRCAQEAGARAARLGLKLRGGIHTGEAEIDGSRVRGVAVHTAARIGALAPPGEVLVSSTVRDLAAGAGFLFDDRGLHELRGVPERRQLYAVR